MKAPLSLDEVRGRAVLTPEETAAVLGVGRNTVYAALKAGQLPSLRLGRKLLIPAPKLLTMLEGEEEPTPAETVASDDAGRILSLPRKLGAVP